MIVVAASLAEKAIKMHKAQQDMQENLSQQTATETINDGDGHVDDGHGHSDDADGDVNDDDDDDDDQDTTD